MSGIVKGIVRLFALDHAHGVANPGKASAHIVFVFPAEAAVDHLVVFLRGMHRHADGIPGVGYDGSGRIDGSVTGHAVVPLIHALCQRLDLLHVEAEIHALGMKHLVAAFPLLGAAAQAGAKARHIIGRFKHSITGIQDTALLIQEAAQTGGMSAGVDQLDIIILTQIDDMVILAGNGLAHKGGQHILLQEVRAELVLTHFCKPESQAICYSWLNSNTKPLEMAEAGYPVVLANANRLYFDFAYCNHHEEKGLNWGGYTDEYRSFDWEPLIHPNVIGMNAQLWGEVIRSFSQVEWQIYPKIYGLAERAWNNRSHLTLGDYNHLVYEVFIPQLAASGHNFHIQQPGIQQVAVDNPQLQLDKSHVLIAMNKVMDGGELLYSLDDGEWRTYTNKTAIPASTKIIKAKVSYLGKESNTTWMWLANEHQIDANAQEKNTGATF